MTASDAASVVAAAPENAVRLNTLGFLPEREKRASIAQPCKTFRAIREDGSTAYRGVVWGPRLNDDTSEEIYTADFTALRAPGRYHLNVDGVGTSAPFRIAGDVYNDAFATVMRGVYLWRCGCAVHAARNGVTFAHGACHLDDAYEDYIGGGHTRRDGTKGWHDAGDYNKYVVNAGVTVGTLLFGWEQFGPRIARTPLALPESGNGTPDYLDEVRWETDWLLTMQAPDGSVYSKVSTEHFGPSGPPEDEKTPRYFVPWGSAATADFTAVCAKAARAFSPYDAAYSHRLLAAAEKSYAFLQAHPEDHRADQTGFSTGGYTTRDPDDRLWAAAEIWETTGSPAALHDLESRVRGFNPKIDVDCGWSNVKNLGMYTYVLSRRPGRDAALVNEVGSALFSVADSIVRTAQDHGYARPLGTVYYWGGNGGVAMQTVLLQVANHLAPKREYVDTALDAIGFLFGRNVDSRSYVTGLGHNPPNHPHDRRSMGTPGAPAWPGYLVGGGHPGARDWRDISARYDLNEIAINWNAPLIFALAGFVHPGPAAQPARKKQRRTDLETAAENGQSSRG